MTEHHAREAGDDPTSRFIERFGVIVEEEGLPRTAGRMFAMLLSAGCPLSFSEIAERLQVSRGGVSTNARLLEEIGLAERVSLAGDRQDYFQFPAHAWERQIERQVARERNSRLCVEGYLKQDGDLPPTVRRRLDYMVSLLLRSEEQNRATLSRIADETG